MIQANHTCPTCHRRYYDPPFTCTECGTELGWTCIACSHGNPLQYRHCGACGEPIPAAIAAMMNSGSQHRIVNVPQFDESAVTELIEEGHRMVARRTVRTLSQSDLDKLFE